MKCCKYKFTYRILIFISIIWLTLTMFKILTNDIENSSEMTASFINSSSAGCNIFNANETQFTTSIDGVRYPKVVPLFQNKSINFACLNSGQTRPKLMLMWNHFRMFVHNKYNFGVRTAFETLKCPVTNCELTNDRRRINESALVLFHLRNRIDELPKAVRPAWQRWVHVDVESPVHCHLCEDAKYENVFNYSSYYSKDSDYTSVYLGDSGIYWEENQHFDLYRDFQASKSKFAASLISNCNTVSMRSEYLKELQRFVNVDIYGKCGIECPLSLDCRQFIADTYLFFLVFENSICRDYITEKFFYTLRHDVIPVVLGGGDYEYYVPKSGFINAIDFETPARLAEYLRYLAANKTAYNDYFKWKKYLKYDPDHPNMSFLCEMCIQLNLEDHTDTRIARRKRLGSLKKLYGLEHNCVGVAKRTLIHDNQSVLAFEYSKEIKLQHSFIMCPENFDYIKKTNI